MNAELSLWRLFIDASFLVQCIMIFLMSLSVISWAFIFQYRRLLKESSGSAEQFEDEFWSGKDLRHIYDRVSGGRSAGVMGSAAIFSAGMRDFQRFHEQNLNKAMAGEHIERAMHIALMRERERLQKNLNWLATIGSVAPYIGLFGTVWGIMHAFISLGAVQQATLAMVAPGIAEALIATAMGLFAAIPAVVAYNRFSNRVNQLLARYQTFAEEVLNVLLKKLLQREKGAF
ncbi:MAG: protein TolQ [Gammaproteobacteria bacterium]